MEHAADNLKSDGLAALQDTVLMIVNRAPMKGKRKRTSHDSSDADLFALAATLSFAEVFFPENKDQYEGCIASGETSLFGVSVSVVQKLQAGISSAQNAGRNYLS